MRKVPSKHVQWLEKELPILESQGVVTAETANGIKSYYSDNTASGLHWAVIAFAVLGSLLIGSGIILLFAHNWDELTRPTRAVLSFVPISLGALLSLIAVLKNGGVALRESAGILHTLAIGASIALVGQTYHVPGNVPGFLLSWSLLSLPLVFILRSSGAGMLYLALICGWSGAAQEMWGHAIGYWLLILPAIGRLAYFVRKDRHAPETLLNFWGVMFALCISTGIVFERTIPGLWIVAYAAMLSGAGLLGMHLYGDRGGWNNPPKVFGMIGIGLMCYLLTWSEMWHDIGWHHYRSGWYYRPWGTWMDGAMAFVFLTGWAAAAVKAVRRNSITSISLAIFPLLAGGCFLLQASGNEVDVFNALVFNAYMLYLGILYIVLGCRDTRLRQLNGGMALLSLLLVTRFFDADFGYLARGIVFIVLGACFLAVNLIMANRKKKKEVAA